MYLGLSPVFTGSNRHLSVILGLTPQALYCRSLRELCYSPRGVIIHLGHVHELTRYPVKSMAGVATDSAFLGWHGLEGDRRFAFRRLNDKSGFPWLTAGRLPELVLYQPLGLDERAEEPAPTHVRTPEGVDLPLGSAELHN